MTLNEKLKATSHAEELIKNYVVANASETLTDKILKGEKNISDCFNFIKGEAKKKATQGCACLSDDEVFGMAIHYFEEDSIKPGAKVEAKVEAPKVEKPKPTKVEAKKEEAKGFEQTSLFDFM